MLIPIVDEKDEIIDHIERADLDYTIHRNRSASCWVIDGKGNVLIAQRSFNKKFDPGKWSESVGGTVDKDMSYRQTIEKEIGEELGIDVDSFRLIELEKQYVDGTERYFVQWYYMVVNKPIDFFTVQKEELEQVAWISIDDLKNDVDKNPDKYISDMKQMLVVLA